MQRSTTLSLYRVSRTLQHQWRSQQCLPPSLSTSIQRYSSSSSTETGLQDTQQQQDMVAQERQQRKLQRKLQRSRRRQNMVFGLLGGAALVGTMVLLVRRDLLADKSHMADQVEQVTRIKTRMKLEEEEKMKEVRAYEEMMDRRKQAHELPVHEPSFNEQVKTALKRRWNSLFMTLGRSLAEASHERQEREKKRMVERIYEQLEGENIARERVVKIRAVYEE